MLKSIKQLLRKPKPNQPKASTTGLRREFVYLDEVSVSSLLTSIRGGITTEFTESYTDSLSREIGGSLNVGLGGVGSNLSGKSLSNQNQASQVIRKATVQTSFKELYDLEKDRLALSSAIAPNDVFVESDEDIPTSLESMENKKWIVDIGNIRRGDPFEVKVELEADPLFRMIMAITTLYGLMGDTDDIFGSVPAEQVRQAYRVGQVLERLLAGLVPLRGRLVEYQATTLENREVLVHQSIKNRMTNRNTGDYLPVYVTGVADNGLFWKDIRQILFSGSEYSVFCRLATEGLKEEWQPVKVANVFEGVISEFKDAIGGFRELARATIEDQERGATAESPGEDSGAGAVKEYIHLLETIHERTVSPEFVENAAASIIPQGDWLESVDGQRKVFDEVTTIVDNEFGVETQGETRRSLRAKALEKSNFTIANQQAALIQRTRETESSDEERFLDAEIVAIYW